MESISYRVRMSGLLNLWDPQTTHLDIFLIWILFCFFFLFQLFMNTLNQLISSRSHKGLEPLHYIDRLISQSIFIDIFAITLFHVYFPKASTRIQSAIPCFFEIVFKYLRIFERCLLTPLWAFWQRISPKLGLEPSSLLDMIHALSFHLRSGGE